MFKVTNMGLVSIVVGLLLASGCSDSSTSDNENGTSSTKDPEIKTDGKIVDPTQKVGSAVTGTLVDSKVIGLSYECGDGTNGITDENAHFDCKVSPVTFKLCNITLGHLDTTGSDILYLQDILGKNTNAYNDPDVIALAQLLLSVDADNVDETITIPQDICTMLSAEEGFNPDHIGDYTNEAGVNLVDAQTASAHLQDTYVKYSKRGNSLSSDVSYYNVVEECDMNDGGGSFGFTLMKWKMKLNKDNDGEVFFHYDIQGTQGDSPLYLVSWPADEFSIVTHEQGATWKHYKLVMNEEFNLYQGSFVEKNPAISMVEREVLNFYGDGYFDMSTIREVAWHHLQNLDCQDSRPEEDIGCPYMWKATMSYTYTHDDTNPDYFYKINGSTEIKNLVLASTPVDLYRAEGLNQCQYLDEEGLSNPQGYPRLSSRPVQSGESQKYKPTCSGAGCTSNISPNLSDDTSAYVYFSTSDIVSISTGQSLISCEPIYTDSMKNSIKNNNSFNVTCTELSNPSPQNTLTLTLTFAPQKNYNREVIYCDLDKLTGVCALNSGATNVIYRPNFK